MILPIFLLSSAAALFAPDNIHGTKRSSTKPPPPILGPTTLASGTTSTLPASNTAGSQEYDKFPAINVGWKDYQAA